MPGQPLGLRALHVAQNLQDDTGKSGVPLSVPAEMDDGVVVSDRCERFYGIVRRASRDFGDQAFHSLGIALRVHGDGDYQDPPPFEPGRSVARGAIKIWSISRAQ